MNIQTLAFGQDQWDRVADLPDPHGLKGVYAGIAQGYAVLAGGSNFPDPTDQNKLKATYRTAYVTPANGPFMDWLEFPNALPRPLAEGASVIVPEGILCIGGTDGLAPTSDVFLITFDPASQTLVTHSLPSLPVSLATSAAALLDGHIYLANGADQNGATSIFLRIEWPVKAQEATSACPWEELPPWPASARFGASLMPVETTTGSQLLLAGGIRTPVRSEDDYLSDAWLYDPSSGRWKEAASMPRAAVLPAAVSLGNDQVALLGGSSGHNFDRMRLMGDRYRIPNDIMVYDATNDLWKTQGEMPLGVVAAGIVPTDGGWIIAGGEYSPGLRTRSVYRWKQEVEQ